MRTGLFGGTFDPIHTGHLIVAETVRSDFKLDRILFIPAEKPPHKRDSYLSPSTVRLKMVELAISRHPNFEISDVEIQRGGTSYTVDTVRWFLESKEWRKDVLYLIVGSDSLLEMETWRDSTIILEKIQTLVVERPGFDWEKGDKRFLKKVTLVQIPLVDISSTEIRRRVREGKSIRYWVPEKVENYIQRKGLYL